VAIGVGTNGYRTVLGLAEGAKEDKAGWLAFLKYLKERGLVGPSFSFVMCVWG
jgi:putative transposase